MKIYTSITFIIVFVGLHLVSVAQANNVYVSITNSENKTFKFSADDLNALPQTTLNIKGEDGVMHDYSGVDIHTLLSKAGVSFEADVRKQTLNSCMLIKAADNYSVIYALAEVDSFFSDKKIILADLKDGKPLPENFGPFQIISTGEKVHARLIRQVTDIIIKKVL